MTVSTETVRMAKSRPRKNQSERSDLPCHIIIRFIESYKNSKLCKMVNFGLADALKNTHMCCCMIKTSSVPSRKMFRNVHLAFGAILENLRKSSESVRKSSENCQRFVIIKVKAIKIRVLNVFDLFDHQSDDDDHHHSDDDQIDRKRLELIF